MKRPVRTLVDLIEWLPPRFSGGCDVEEYLNFAGKLTFYGLPLPLLLVIAHHHLFS